MSRLVPALRRRLRPLAASARWATSRKWRRHALVGPPELWQMKRQFQIAFLLRTGLEPHHYVLDLGCGTLRGGIPIIDHLDPGHYFGVDVRADVLEHGRRELAEAGLTAKEPTLVHAPDLAGVDLGQAFDVVWAFSVLIHLTDEILDDALAFAARHLAAGGSLYANVNVGEGYDGSWEGFPVVGRSWEFYTECAARHGLNVEDVGSLGDVGHHSGSPLQDSARVLRARPA